MKLSAAICTLALLGQSNGQCPSELTGVESITSTLTMYYSLILSGSEPGILCARIESATESWLGWGINPSGEMIGGEAVIGLPDQGTVRKFMLNDESMEGVVEMEDAAQTLMETSIVQENGMTIMSFAKYLDEDQYGIAASGSANSFIYAIGSSNTLGFHADEGNFFLQFPDVETLTSSSLASVATTSVAAATTVNSLVTTSIAAVTTVNTSGPTVGENETEIVATPSPSIAEYNNGTTNPTVASIESSTPTSTDSPTSSSTSSSPQIETEPADVGDYSSPIFTDNETVNEADSPSETNHGVISVSHHRMVFEKVEAHP
ncbi:hypothetical protein ACHAW6_014692 [Cyclotella cf. meneghiniana]